MFFGWYNGVIVALLGFFVAQIWLFVAQLVFLSALFSVLIAQLVLGGFLLLFSMVVSVFYL